MENVFNEAKVSQDVRTRVYESVRKEVEELAQRRNALEAEHAALKQRYVEACEAEIERERKAFEEAQKKEEKMEEKTELFPADKKPRVRWQGDFAGTLSIYSHKKDKSHICLRVDPSEALAKEALGKRETKYFSMPLIQDESYEGFAKRFLDLIKEALDWRVLRNRELLRQSKNYGK